MWIPSSVRTVLRRVRRAPERYLHPLRRARFRRELAEHDRPSILVVCLGNICRSPYAEHRLQAELASRGIRDMEIASAGFVQPGRPSPPEAKSVASRRGLDLSSHVSVVLDDQMVKDAGLILVMSRRQRRDLARAFGRTEDVFVLGDADPLAVESRTIKDPVEKPEGVFEVVYDRIDRCCELLVSTLVPQALARSGAKKQRGATAAAATTDALGPGAEDSRGVRAIRMVVGV